MSTTIIITLSVLAYMLVVTQFLKKISAVQTDGVGPITLELLFMSISLVFPLLIVAMIVGFPLDLIFSRKNKPDA